MEGDLPPEPPASGETNWVQTVPGRHWFAYTRFYGPLVPYFDRSWKLGDITPQDAETPLGREAGGVGFS
ncbi:hypothetical protein [Streptomyces sp. NPDC002122]|uniref:hypothetical protein n=1 Tax=Streptomyces sp. NPDC002122 TaxID=3154407 RepID=UPI003320F3A4